MTINLQDLRESNEFLNHILDNMGAAVLIADENFRIHQFNDSFLNLFDSYFIIVCMSIDTRRGVLTYGGAGHPPPVLLRAAGALETLDYHGSVIGFGSDSPYGQRELRLEPGDKIILYTDGLTENRGREGRAVGRVYAKYRGRQNVAFRELDSYQRKQRRLA